MLVNKENENVNANVSTDSQNEQEKNPLVHEDQQSMFDVEEAFSEAVVVEKSEVVIDSSAQDEAQDEGDTIEFDTVEKAEDTVVFDVIESGAENLPEEVQQQEESGDTAVFDVAQHITKEEEQEWSAETLQGTAKDYYKATHSESIEDTVDELKKFAGEEFTSEDAAVIEERLSDIESVPDKKTLKMLEKQKKKESKMRRKGYVSNDDMEMLSNLSQEKAQDVPSMVSEVFDEATQTTTYENPLADSEELDEETRLFNALGGEKKKLKSLDDALNNDEPEVEYTSRDQNETILSGLRNRAVGAIISMAVTLVLTLLCVYFEASSGTSAPHPSVFEPGKFGLTYALSMLQIMFVGIMFNLDGVKRAFLGMRPTRSSAEGFCGGVLCVCTLHTILSCILASDSPSLKTYCSVGCISLMLLSVNSFIKAYTSLSAFCVAASKAPKFSSFELERNSLEAAAFEKYLDDETTVITVGKGDFVKGFFRKSSATPLASAGTFKRMLIVFIVAIAAAVASGILSNDVYTGVCVFSTVCLASFPANALISTALPFFIASSGVKKSQTAFIGEAACDSYDNCGVISFDDTEVFPKRSVKVSSIRTYGQNRIDKVILYMARIFDKVEGPLSFVFANSVQNIEDDGIEAQIGEHFSNGISARVDGKEILVGTDAFMRLYDIETTTDNIDESFIQSYGSIMYMSVGGTLAAKFYIKYAMNRGFEEVLHAFYDAGICVGIKSLDPCISTELVCGNLKGANYPVAVIKNHTRKDEPEVKENTTGAVISLSGIHNFLKGFVKLDNLRNIYRTNTIISLISMIIGIILVAFTSISGGSVLGTMFVVLFQLIWCLPTVIFSFLSK